jgi:DNA adenine methylase
MSSAKLVKEGDFVYLDPPYAPVADDSFRAYTIGGFTIDDQVQLRDEFKRLDVLGAKLMLSNSDVSSVRELYRDFHIDRVQTNRSVSRNADQRGKVTELVIRNY